MVSQILAVVIFVVMFVEIVREKFPRYLVTLVAGVLTLVVVFLLAMQSLPDVWKALSLESMAETTFWYTGHMTVNEMNTGINWSTILFISGMMIMVEGMSEAGFFDWLCLRLAKLVNYKPVPLMICFMILSAVLSMFIDSITVILFLAVASVRLAHLLKFDPIPLIIAEIFTANLGGAATMSGDPPNIIIGTALAMSLDPRASISSRKAFVVNVTIFLVTVLLLVTHAKTGLTVATVGIVAAILTLLANPAPLRLLRKVDWQTVLFFLGLFLTVSGLEQTGVLEAMANGIAGITGGNLSLMIVILIWLSAVASAFVDNIPFAATMVPVISSLSATMGVDLNTLAWTLSMGTDIGGSATPIGASANVAGTAIAAREGHPISWGRYCKYSAPAAVIVVAISMAVILLRY